MFNINVNIMSKQDQYQCSNVQYQCQHNFKTGSLSVFKDLSMSGSVSMLQINTQIGISVWVFNVRTRNTVWDQYQCSISEKISWE